MQYKAEFGIIGGGPGGLALPISQSAPREFDEFSQRGAIIFEAGNEANLGRGRLGHYNGIGSNSLPSEFATIGKTSRLAGSWQTAEGRVLQEYIQAPEALSVPLSVVADFYHQVGRCLKQTWAAEAGPSQVLTNTKIDYAQQCANAQGETGWDLVSQVGAVTRVKNLILATGAQAKPVPDHLVAETVTVAEEVFNRSKLLAIVQDYQAGKNIGIAGASHSGLLCLAEVLEQLELVGVPLRPNSIQVYTNGHDIRVFHDESEVETAESGTEFRVKSTGQSLAAEAVCHSTNRAFRYTGARGKAGEAGKRLQREASQSQSPLQIVAAKNAANKATGHLIWATGLEADKIRLLDHRGQPIEVALSRGEYAADENGLLRQTDDEIVPQAGVIGVAGGLLPESSLGGEDLARQLGVRLHSVNFYHQQVAQRLLAALS